MAHTCSVSLFIVPAIVSVVAQLLAVQSSVITQKGAVYRLSAEKKSLEKDKAQKGSIEKL